MDTSISSRASTKQVQNVEHYNFEQGTGTHEFGVVMLPNVSDVPMRYHKPEVVVDPRRLHHASDNFCYATRTLSSEDCYVQGATLQDIKNDTMKHQLGQLMLISVLFGSMLLCQWMTKELQRGTIIGDACLRERNAIQRSRTLGPDMGERRQVSGVIGWRTLRYIYYVLLFSASMLTATASEDDNVLQQLHQRRLAQVQQPQVPTPTPLDHRWANFEETYRLPRPDPGSYYDAVIARPDVILQHRGTSLSLRLHYAAEPHRYQTLIEGHWQDIFIDVSPNNEWRVHSMNEAAYGSSFFPAAYRHFILTTDWERHTCSGHRAIAVEVIWRTPNGESTVLMRPWIPTTTTTVGFLQALGLLHGCMTSHRCHATINGQTCVTRWVQFTHGTYVKVDAYPMQIPEDTESEGEEPAPIAGATFEDDATTTSSESSSNSIDPLYLDDAFITDTIVVHRPPGRVPRPLRLIQTVEHADGPVLHIYTDGSASTRQEEEDNAWAIAIFAAEDKDSPWHQRTLIDWYRGLCERDPLSTQWLGATDSSSRTAEAEGLIWSLLWFVQSHRTGPIHLHSDALSVRNAANGQWKKKMLSYSDSAPCTKWSILCWDFDARSWPYRRSRE